MHFVIFICGAVFLAAVAISDRLNRRREEQQAARDLAPRNMIDTFDRMAAAMLRNDPWAETDRAWCAEFDIAWPAMPPARPLPQRPARHGSPHRLHRGF